MKLELFVPAEVYGQLKTGLQQLESLNCKAIIIPCNTVHVFYEKLQSQTSLKIFSLVDLAIQKVLQSKHKNIAVVSSDFTYKSQLYAKALISAGLSPILVTPAQQEILNQIILKVMAGTHSTTEFLALQEIIQDLHSKGATSLILGCTELPLVLTADKHSEVNLTVFDSIQISTEALVDFAYLNSEFNPNTNV
jgi:aspartate racemase